MIAVEQLALDLWGLTDGTEEQPDYRAAWLSRHDAGMVPLGGVA